MSERPPGQFEGVRFPLEERFTGFTVTLLGADEAEVRSGGALYTYRLISGAWVRVASEADTSDVEILPETHNFFLGLGMKIDTMLHRSAHGTPTPPTLAPLDLGRMRKEAEALEREDQERAGTSDPDELPDDYDTR